MMNEYIVLMLHKLNWVQHGTEMVLRPIKDHISDIYQLAQAAGGLEGTQA